MTANSGQRPAGDTVVTIPAPVNHHGNPRWISTNAQHNRHPNERSKMVAPWRDAAALAAAGMPPSPTPVAVTATIHKSRNNRWDIDGIVPTVKACIDGLRDAGVLAEDDDQHIPALTVRVGCVCRDARVELRIETLTNGHAA